MEDGGRKMEPAQLWSRLRWRTRERHWIAMSLMPATGLQTALHLFVARRNGNGKSDWELGPLLVLRPCNNGRGPDEDKSSRCSCTYEQQSTRERDQTMSSATYRRLSPFGRGIVAVHASAGPSARGAGLALVVHGSVGLECWDLGRGQDDGRAVSTERRPSNVECSAWRAVLRRGVGRATRLCAGTVEMPESPNCGAQLSRLLGVFCAGVAGCRWMSLLCCVPRWPDCRRCQVVGA